MIITGRSLLSGAGLCPNLPLAIEQFGESPPLGSPAWSPSAVSVGASNRLRHSLDPGAGLLPKSGFPSLNSGVTLGAGEALAVLAPLPFFFSSSFFLLAPLPKV